LRKGKKILKSSNIYKKNIYIFNKINIVKNPINPAQLLLPPLKKKIKITIPRQKRDFIIEDELKKIIN